jgi:hypothetical protein
MEIKEPADDSIDYSFISKYIRDDSAETKENVNKESPLGFSLKNFQSQDKGSTEVFGSIGEDEIYSENPNSKFHKRSSEGDFDSEDSGEPVESDDSDEKVESGPTSKAVTDAKKEFRKHLEEKNNTLTIDACEKVNHDWKKR